MTRYFFMEQNTALSDSIKLRDFDLYGKRHIFTWKDREKVLPTTFLYLASDSGECAPDFIKSPVYLVSEKVKKVIEQYEDGLVFPQVVFMQKEEEKQLLYYHLLLPEIPALAETTAYYPNGIEKRQVLQADKCKGHHVFLLADSTKKLPVVSQKVVESLCRQHTLGIEWEEIPVEGDR